MSNLRESAAVSAPISADNTSLPSTINNETQTGPAQLPSKPQSEMFVAGDQSSAAPAIVDGIPTPEETRTKLHDFWDKGDAGNKTDGPHGRWEDRTGVIVPTTAPASGDDMAASTLVSVHLSGLSTSAALDAFGKQTGVRLSVYPKNMWNGRSFPTVSFDADKKPLLEAVSELCCKTGLSPFANQMWGAPPQLRAHAPHPRMYVNVQQPDNALGPWEISGAFAFEVTQISHTLPLSVAGTANSLVHLTLGMLHEPKIVVLGFGASPTLTEAVDDKGNNLIGGMPVQPNGPPARRSWASLLLGSRSNFVAPAAKYWAFANQPMGINLTYPPDAGRTITHLRGTERFIVQTQSETVETPVMEGRKSPDKTIAGVRYVVGPLTIQGEQQFNCPIEFTRATMTPDDWRQFSAAVLSLRPTMVDEQGKAFSNMQANPGGSSTDSVTANLYWWQQYSNSGSGFTRRPAKLMLDVPTKWQQIEIPIQFDDLPFP